MMKNETAIKLSIVMITYHHERFIQKALDSILMQQVNFSYEVVIGEDCSPDETKKILIDYKRRYPDKIKLILREKNIGMMRNMLDTLRHCRGEYLAFLEGDDYWISPHKLQKQFDFLECQKEYIAVFHKCCMVNQNAQVLEVKMEMNGLYDEDYTMSNVQKFELPGQTGTIMMRNRMGEWFQKYGKLLRKIWMIPLDRILPILLLQKGKIFVMGEVMSAYRYYLEEGGTNWSSKHEIQAKKNYFYFYYIMYQLEHLAKSMNVKLDLIEEKARMFREALRRDPSHKKNRYYLQCVGIILVEPHKFRLVKEMQRRRKKEKSSR